MSEASNEVQAPHRWVMLGVSMWAQVSGTVFVNAAPFLIPYLHLQRGLSLVEAGLVASAPLIGMMLTLIAWGAVVDWIGERTTMALGLGLVAAASAAAASTDSIPALAVFLFIGGAAGGSTNSASGRVVIGWFPPARRGFAMGIRQTAQPIGVGAAALLVPNLVASRGTPLTFVVVAVLCASASALVWWLVVDPPRPDRAAAESAVHLANPYRQDDRLWRIHAASMLLVVPQFTVWTYMLVWLIDERGWTTFAASALVGGTQVLGSAGRIAAGAWSDRVGSRLGPMRLVAVAAAGTMLALGLLEGTVLAVTLMVLATIVTVADNGLAFTSVAEIGGPFWSGRAMGTQNTGQFLAAAAVPPGVGALIIGTGYGWAFATVAAFPLAAVALVPVRGEHPAA